VSEEDLEKAALEAIASAAERLGVDPFRLARYLAHGRIADFLQALGRGETIDPEDSGIAGLAGSYVQFLGEETRRRQHGPGQAGNGG
jgi:hypothetical protein